MASARLGSISSSLPPLDLLKPDSRNVSTTKETTSPTSATTSTNYGTENVTATTGEQLMLAQALYDYQALKPNHLSFTQGDIFEITEKFDTGWWLARSRQDPAKVGYIPSNYFKEVAPSEPVLPDISTIPVPHVVPKDEQIEPTPTEPEEGEEIAENETKLATQPSAVELLLQAQSKMRAPHNSVPSVDIDVAIQPHTSLPADSSQPIALAEEWEKLHNEIRKNGGRLLSLTTSPVLTPAAATVAAIGTPAAASPANSTSRFVIRSEADAQRLLAEHQQAEIARLERQLALTEEQLHIARGRARDRERELEEALEKALRERERFAEDASKLRAELAAISKARNAAEKEAAELFAKLSESNLKIATLESENEDLKSKIKGIAVVATRQPPASATPGLTTTTSSVAAVATAAASELTITQQLTTTRLKQRILELESELAKKDEEIRRMSELFESFAPGGEESGGVAGSVKKSFEEYRSRLEGATTTIAALENELSRTRAEIQKRNEEYAALEAATQELVKQKYDEVVELKQKLQALTEAAARTDSNHGRREGDVDEITAAKLASATRAAKSALERLKEMTLMRQKLESIAEDQQYLIELFETERRIHAGEPIGVVGGEEADSAALLSNPAALRKLIEATAAALEAKRNSYTHEVRLRERSSSA